MSKEPVSPNNPSAGTVEELLEEARVARDREGSSRLSEALDLESLKRPDYEAIAWRKKESKFFRISGRTIRASRVLSVPASVPWVLMLSEIDEWKDSFSVVCFFGLLAHLWFPNWLPRNIRNFDVDMVTRRLYREPVPPHIFLVLGWLIFLVPAGAEIFRYITG